MFSAYWVLNLITIGARLRIARQTDRIQKNGASMNLSIIKPLDQPVGIQRLLTKLKDALADDRFSQLYLIVAFAKSGPLHRLHDLLDSWRAKGSRIEAILGFDQHGTSREALELSLALFDVVYVTREPSVTFHPKIYLFKGVTAARAFIGSNNLTVGGTEKNFEATVQLDFEIPREAEAFATVEEAWTTLLPDSCPATKLLNDEFLKQLIDSGDVIAERAMRYGEANRNGVRSVSRRNLPRTGLIVRPESTLPRQPRVSKTAKTLVELTQPVIEPKLTETITPGHEVESIIPPPFAEGLAIQIKPHHNGEIFLSVSAALQYPEFFNWPFKGQTVPKKSGNPSYPQLTPDPVVNVGVYGVNETPLLTLSAYSLNTVYYQRKSEIRITASPLVGVVPDYSVMIIHRGETEGIDYEITIHTPESPDYAVWVAACDQTMPGGGKTPRKFGWF